MSYNKITFNTISSMIYSTKNKIISIFDFSLYTYQLIAFGKVWAPFFMFDDIYVEFFPCWQLIESKCSNLITCFNVLPFFWSFILLKKRDSFLENTGCDILKLLYAPVSTYLFYILTSHPSCQCNNESSLSISNEILLAQLMIQLYSISRWNKSWKIKSIK